MPTLIDSPDIKLPNRIPISKWTLFIGVALLSQLGFWFYCTPWPQLQLPNNFSEAVTSCIVAGLVFLVLPLLVAIFVLERRPSELGLCIGDRAFGLKAIFWCAPAMMIGTWIGSGDPQIQEFYPMPGDEIGRTLPGLLLWFLVYLIYYVSFEFFFRGFLLLGVLNPDESRVRVIWTCIAIQALLCFLIHIGKPNAELIASLPASVLFGWIAWRSRSIWYGLAIHFLVGIVNDLGAIG